VAARAITVVRDTAGLLPVRPDAATRIAAVMPRPADLTPADTSSTIEPGLAAALRARTPTVTEIVTSIDPPDAEVAAVRAALADHDLVVIGTIAAALHPGQASLVGAILATGRPVLTVALRTPWDLAAYPAARTHLCTYDLQPVTLAALAAVVVGAAPSTGRLPVAIDGIAPLGHRWGD
jgi:beta-N-acetylhexosaminidase